MPKPRFRLSSRGLVLAAVSAAFAGTAHAAPAGRIEFAIGDATLRGAGGFARPAEKNGEIDSGDTVVTGRDGRVQIRFSDGAYVSVQPNTEFGIREYRYDGRTDGSERGFFALARGALRTITGLIGRVHRSSYRITTPTATVGIRGTGGLISVLPDFSTVVSGTSGIWLLSNQAGQIPVPAGTSAIAGPDFHIAPHSVPSGPVILPTPITQLPPVLVEGEQRDSSGGLVALGGAGAPTPPLANGGGYSLQFLNAAAGGGDIGGNATFDATGGLLTYVGPNVNLDASGAQNLDQGAVAGVMSWGRWANGTVTCSGRGCGNFTSATLGTNDGVHYVVGLPTPAMPTSGSVPYTLVGATTPTWTIPGAKGLGTFNSGSLVADFGLSTLAVSLNVTANGTPYSVQTPSYPSTSGSPVNITGANFSGNFTAFSCGGSGCSTSITGFFAGSGASNAGLIYNFSDVITGTNVTGAAAFKQ